MRVFSMGTAHTSLRLPPDVKAFIEDEARENASSQNSEIVRAIRAVMKSKKRPSAVSDVARDLLRPVCARIER
jgi:hypothetical protein